MSVSRKPAQRQQQNNPISVAVSACLLGQNVRYDGAAKYHPFVARQLPQLVQLLPLCPEVEIGMGVPRPPIHLIESGGRLRAIGVDETRLDVTRGLSRLAVQRSADLARVSGYVFKARSPSCGITSTPRRRADGRQVKGAGLFAAQVMRRWPLLPLVEEGALENVAQQANFLQRVAAYSRWQAFVRQRPGWPALLVFHQANRLALMAHGAPGLRRFEAWLNGLDRRGHLSAAQLQAYGQHYMAQFGRLATRRRHLVVLRHLTGWMRHALTHPDYQALRAAIDAYAVAQMPLSQVLARFRACQAGQASAAQTYLEPPPAAWQRLFDYQ